MYDSQIVNCVQYTSLIIHVDGTNCPFQELGLNFIFKPDLLRERPFDSDGRGGRLGRLKKKIGSANGSENSYLDFEDERKRRYSKL